jgi:predicted deacylase
LGVLTFALPAPALGAWRRGNVGIEGVWRFDSDQPGREVMIGALVHGNELCGAWALLDLLEAGLRPRRGALTLAFCNLAAFDRFDANDHDASRFVEQDMNRVWGPGLREAPSPTQEQRRARDLLPFVERADALLDLHSMHEPGPPLLLTGPHERNIGLARRLATPEHVVVDAGHTDGLRMRDHGRFGNPTCEAESLLIECGWHGDLASRHVALDMCARFLAGLGVIDETDLPAAWRRAVPAQQQVLDVTHGIVARSEATRFAAAWASGQCIAQAGTVLGWREDEPFVTPYDDCTIVMPSLRQLRPGVTVMRLARRRF